MDIENLRKIQETEKALRIHSINLSTQEALEAVSNDVMVGGNKVPSFEEVHGYSQQPAFAEVKEEVTIAPTQQSNSTITQEVSKMDDRIVMQLKKTLEEHDANMTKQAQLINQLQGVVNEIIKEINKMQSSVPTKNPSERQQVLKAEEKTQHPRSGGYKPEDVSVDKFFNFSGSR